jgi:hypothetical protein
MSNQEKLDVLDLIISTLRDHEKTLDQIETRLEGLTEQIDITLKAHKCSLGTMLKYYAPINQSKNM